MFRKNRVVPGYKHFKPGPQAVFHSVNRCIAFLLIIVALPVFLAVALIILAAEGRPLFYVSHRLGLHKKKFAMYKFRTLPQGIDKILTQNYFTYTLQSLPFLTKFLRESRLDELPQLVNVLKGEMNFIGPRPVRPQIYESMCKNIPNYDYRFTVLPGLIGFSQLFTPHSAPKKIRSLIDNNLIRRNKRLQHDALLLFFTVFVLGNKFFLMGYRFLRGFILSAVSGKLEDRRILDRIRHSHAYCHAYSRVEYDQEIYRKKLIDINELYFCIIGDESLESKEYYFKIEIKSGKRKKTAKVKGVFFRKYRTNKENGYRYIFAYEAINAFHQYLLDQYFLNKSIYKL